MRNLSKLKSAQGAAYFDTVISVFVVMILLAAFMSIVPVFMKKYELDMAAEDIARMISVSGQTAELDPSALTEEYGVQIDSVSVAIDGDSVTGPASSGSGQIIQLSGGFTVSLESHHVIGIGGIVPDINVGLSSSAHGRSEVFWKSLA